MVKILIIKARTPKDEGSILNDCVDAATKVIKEHTKIDIDILKDYPLFSLPCAASISLEINDYDGMVIIGYGEFTKESGAKTIYKEVVRSFTDLSMHYALPIGFALVMIKPGDDVKTLAMQAAVDAAHSCIELLKLKNELGFSSNAQFARYNN
jgi:6,7-dimethyl-8-ribityllumazine synthase